MAQVKDFRPGSTLLRNIVQNQLGSTSQALLELVQNAVDSKASVINIQLEVGGFFINDNGEGIDVDFSLVGEDFKADDPDSVGEHGTGRLKCLILGPTVWRTFKNGVVTEFWGDLDKFGLAYMEDKDTCSVAERGTSVSVDFKRRLGNQELTKTIEEFTKSLKAIKILYDIEIDFVTNYQKVDLDEGMDFAFKKETDTCVILLNNTDGTIEIYNKGFYVKDFSWSGLSGMVISKQKIAVTNERDNVRHDCPVFSDIKVELVRYLTQQYLQLSSLRASHKNDLAAFVNLGIVKVSEVEHIKLLRTANGGWVSINDVRDKRIGFAEEGDWNSDKVNEMGFGVMLADSFRTRGLLREANISYASVEEVTAVENSMGFNYEALEDEDLAKKYKRTLVKNLILARTMCHEVFYSSRKIGAGISDHARAWTDSGDYINLNVRELDERNPVRFCASVYPLLAHELAHDCITLGTHQHGDDFNQNLREIVESNADRFGKFMESLVKGEFSEEIKFEYIYTFGLGNSRSDYK